MQPPRVAVLLALAGVLVGSGVAAAPKGKRSVRPDRPVRGCPAFRQTRMGNDGLRFELRNTCGFPVGCTLSWSVHCRGDGESPGERSAQLELAVGASDSAVASGSACGPDGWDIDTIRWTCDRRKGNSGKDPTGAEDL
jgi:hypothetical protein